MDENVLLFGVDNDNKKSLGDIKLTPSQQSCFWCTKIICAVFFFISAIAAGALALAIPDTFTVFSDATTDFRTGAIVAPNVFPAVALQAVGSIDIGLAAAFSSLLAFLGYLFNTLFHTAEIEQMSRGVNPYIWIFQLLWAPVVFIVVAFQAGASNVFVFTSLALFTWAWVVIWWLDDLLTSNAYLRVLQIDRDENGGGFFSTAASFSWIPFVFSLVFALAAYVFELVYLGFTFTADTPPSSVLVVSPLVVLFFYLGLPIIVGLAGGGYFIETLYARDLAIYIYGGWVIFLSTWLTLGLNAAV